MGDKKEAVVTTPLSEKKSLISEKAKTSDEVHTRTEKVTTSEDFVKDTAEVYKRTDNIKSNDDDEKVTKIGRYERGSGHNP